MFLLPDSRVLVEVAPAKALGAGPVVEFLLPGLVGEDGCLVLRPSDNSEFGFALEGLVDDIESAAAALRARFGEAVLVGDLELIRA